MVPYKTKIQSIVNNLKTKQTVAQSPKSDVNVTVVAPVVHEDRIITCEGFIKEKEVAYCITAFDAYGESEASKEFSKVIASSIEPVKPTHYEYAPGILPIGIYHYGVTATNAYGETNIVDVLTVKNNGTPAPEWADEDSVVRDEIGLLPSGTYFYSVTSIANGKESIDSTPKEVIVDANNSSVTLKFKAVLGVTGYNIYRRSVGTFDGEINNKVPKKIGYVGAEAQHMTGGDIEFTDNGDVIGTETVPTFNMTTAGVRISWEAVDDATGYKIYGRESPNSDEMKLIGTVDSSTLTFVDDGMVTPGVLAPSENTTGFTNGAGVEFTWEKSENAIGYKIYGRSKTKKGEEKKGLLAIIDDANITGWKDTGVLSPDYQTMPPKENTTGGSKGVLGSVIPDGVTLSVNGNGLLSVMGGIDSFLGRSEIHEIDDKHILIFNKVTQKWTNIDFASLVFTILVMAEKTDGAVEVTEKDGKIVVPISKEFNDYKSNLAEILTATGTITDDNAKIKASIKALEDKIEELNKKIGTPFKDLK